MTISNQRDHDAASVMRDTAAAMSTQHARAIEAVCRRIGPAVCGGRATRILEGSQRRRITVVLGEPDDRLYAVIVSGFDGLEYLTETQWFVDCDTMEPA